VRNVPILHPQKSDCFCDKYNNVKLILFY